MSYILAHSRREQIRDELPLSFDTSTLIPSYSNDVWIADQYVLRVCWRGDIERLVIESKLGFALPRAVGYPETLAWGRSDGMVWQIQERVDGQTLDTTWPHQSNRSLREIVFQIAEVYRALHEWEVPPTVRALLQARTERQQVNTRAHLLPLPIPHAQQLLGELGQLEWFPPDLIEATHSRLEELLIVDPYPSNSDSWSLIHSDAAPSNILIHEGRVNGLLDFEWARLGPIDSELTIWLHLMRLADLESKEFPPVFGWFKEDYPELFSSAELRERLWLYQLAYMIHGIAIWPPNAPESSLAVGHHIHTLRRLVDGPLFPFEN